MPYLDDFKQVFQNGKEIDRIYTGGSLIWKSNVEYERYNSLLEYTWREYDTTLQYTWRQYNLQTNNVVKYGDWDFYSMYEEGVPRGYQYRNNGRTFTLYGDRKYSNKTVSVFATDKVGNSTSLGPTTLIYEFLEVGDNRVAKRRSLTIVGQKVKGTYRGTVTSTSSTAYPTNGQSGSYWYDTRTSSYVKTTYRGEVKSTNSTAYPTNGQSGTYWYDTRTSEYIKGSYIDIVEAEEGTLPNGGRHTDGYWYVLKG